MLGPKTTGDSGRRYEGTLCGALWVLRALGLRAGEGSVLPLTGEETAGEPSRLRNGLQGPRGRRQRMEPPPDPAAPSQGPWHGVSWTPGDARTSPGGKVDVWHGGRGCSVWPLTSESSVPKGGCVWEDPARHPPPVKAGSSPRDGRLCLSPLGALVPQLSLPRWRAASWCPRRWPGLQGAWGEGLSLPALLRDALQAPRQAHQPARPPCLLCLPSVWHHCSPPCPAQCLRAERHRHPVLSEHQTARYRAEDSGGLGPRPSLASGAQDCTRSPAAPVAGDQMPAGLGASRPRLDSEGLGRRPPPRQLTVKALPVRHV